MLNRLADNGVMTHMPFLTAGLDGRSVLLFCASGDSDIERLTGSRRWKLHVAESGRPIRRIQTRMGQGVTECSPTGWQDADGWHVTFIAGGAEPDPRFRLYQMNGGCLQGLSPPIEVGPAFSGFADARRSVRSELKETIYIDSDGAMRTLRVPGALLYRVSYRADAPNIMLISGKLSDADDVFSIEYDLDTGAQNAIECDGCPAYKCTMYGPDVLYARRTGDGFEHRRVYLAETVKRTPVTEPELRIEDDGIMRPDLVEVMR